MYLDRSSKHTETCKLMAKPCILQSLLEKVICHRIPILTLQFLTALPTRKDGVKNWGVFVHSSLFSLLTYHESWAKPPQTKIIDNLNKAIHLLCPHCFLQAYTRGASQQGRSQDFSVGTHSFPSHLFTLPPPKKKIKVIFQVSRSESSRSGSAPAFCSLISRSFHTRTRIHSTADRRNHIDSLRKPTFGCGKTIL